MAKQKIDPALVAQLAAALGLSAPATAVSPRSPRSNSKPSRKPASKPADVSSYTVRRGPDYLGHPMVQFVTPTGREINLGFSKVRLILAHAAACQRIVSAATVTSTATVATSSDDNAF